MSTLVPPPRAVTSRSFSVQKRPTLLEPLEARLLLSHSVADLANTWLLAGTDAAGTVQFDGAGNVTGGDVTDSSHTHNVPLGTYSITPTGAVSLTTGSVNTGQLNSTNDFLALENTTKGDLNFIVDSQHASFSLADLTGSWTVAFNGAAPDSNGVGTITFNGNGAITGGSMTSGKSTNPVTGGSYTISPTGVVAISINQTKSSDGTPDTHSFSGALNDSKDILVASPLDIQSAVANTDYTLITFTRSVGVYTKASLSGSWTVAGHNTTGVLTFDGAGHVSGSSVNLNHGASTISGTYTIAASGTLAITLTLTDSGNTKSTLGFTGALNASHNTVLMNHVDSANGNNLTALISASDHAPTLTTVSPFATATERQPFSLSYTQLLAHANAHDPDSDRLSFLITTVASGTFTLNGNAVVAGSTLITAGDTLSWTPAAGAKGLVSAFSIKASDGTLTSPAPVAVKITTDLLPAVSVVAPKSKASELKPTTTGQGQFILTRKGDLSTTLTVGYALSGSATNGVDYQTLTGSVTFAVNAATAIINVTPIDHVLTEGAQTVILTLLNDTNAVPGYSLSSKHTAMVTIADHQIAPASIAGNSFALTIASGSFPFASAGTYQLIFSATNDTYVRIGSGGIASSTGTFTYTKTGAATAQFTFSDNTLGNGTGTFSFSSSTAATFNISLTASAVSQTGSLKRSPSPTALLAPSSLANRTATAHITSGSAPLASSGSFQLAFAPATYTLTGSGSVVGSTGSYTYQRLNPTTALVQSTDSLSGPNISILTFTSPTKCSYLQINLGTNATQRGTMTFA